MIHSRPGFAPRSADDAPARLNDDMIPAIHRKPLGENTNLKQSAAGSTVLETLLDARTEEVMAKLAREHPPAEILVNPTPSDPPKILEPGK